MTPRVINFGAIIAIAAALFAIDTALASLERNETARDARQYYGEGERLLKINQNDDAVEAFGRAHTLDRTNRNYQLGLIAALIASHRYADARVLLDAALQEDPGNGHANLLMARLMTTAGDFDQAQSYYHRAIYGTWPDHPQERRSEVRLELIELLAGRHQSRELLSELLPLEEETGSNPGMRKQIARLFLTANSPTRAMNLYRAIIGIKSQDPALYDGLGQAELELGNYQAAFGAFSTASRLEPGNEEIRQKLDLTNEVTSLDPTMRWLTSNAKYGRSTKLLQLAHDGLEKCGLNDSAKPVLGQSEKLLAAKPPARATNEDAEARLSLAEQLWSLRPATCPAGPEIQPLRLIVEKLKQMK